MASKWFLRLAVLVQLVQALLATITTAATATTSATTSLVMCETTNAYLTPDARGEIDISQLPRLDKYPYIYIPQAGFCPMNILMDPGCRIKIKKSAGKNLSTDDLDSSSDSEDRESEYGDGFGVYRGDHLQIAENGYDSLNSKIYLSRSSDESFLSQTRSIRVAFWPVLFTNFQKERKFKIQYQVTCPLTSLGGKNIFEDYTETVIGGIDQPAGRISSIGFPGGYYQNGDIFSFYVNNTGGGKILLQFDDWSLDSRSEMLIHLNGRSSSSEQILKIGGGSNRPVVLSQGSDLIIEFKTSAMALTMLDLFPYMGFSASVDFLRPSQKLEWLDNPINIRETYFYTDRFGYSPLGMRCGRDVAVGSWADFLWVVPRQTPSRGALVLTLGQLTVDDGAGEYLKIIKGNSSLGEPILWEVRQGQYFVPEGELYIRLRQKCTSNQLRFSFTLSWQIITTTMSTRWPTSTRRAPTTTTDDYDPFHNYGFLSIMMPVLMVSLIILIVSCVVVVFMLRRKRQLLVHARIARERALMHAAVEREAAMGIYGLHADGEFGSQQQLMQPPSYDDAVMDFAAGDPVTSRQPPPYSEHPKPEEQVVQGAHPGALPPIYGSLVNLQSAAIAPPLPSASEILIAMDTTVAADPASADPEPISIIETAYPHSIC